MMLHDVIKDLIDIIQNTPSDDFLHSIRIGKYVFMYLPNSMYNYDMHTTVDGMTPYAVYKILNISDDSISYYFIIYDDWEYAIRITVSD